MRVPMGLYASEFHLNPLPAPRLFRSEPLISPDTPIKDKSAPGQLHVIINPSKIDWP
jgi:hypothetical protein